MANAAVVPDYSGGTAVDLHHLPFCLPTQETDAKNSLDVKGGGGKMAAPTAEGGE
jgi:hypothetical protein